MSLDAFSGEPSWKHDDRTTEEEGAVHRPQQQSTMMLHPASSRLKPGPDRHPEQPCQSSLEDLPLGPLVGTGPI